MVQSSLNAPLVKMCCSKSGRLKLATLILPKGCFAGACKKIRRFRTLPELCVLRIQLQNCAVFNFCLAGSNIRKNGVFGVKTAADRRENLFLRRSVAVIRHLFSRAMVRLGTLGLNFEPMFSALF